MQSFLRWTIKFAFSLAVVVAIIGAILRIFFVDLAVVGHNGMAPTLVAGDQIAIWRHADLDLGNITICPHPGEPGRYVLGRIVGKPSFLIESMRGGQLGINGVIVQRDFGPIVRFTDTLANRTDLMTQGIEKLGNTEHEFFERKGAVFVMRPTKVTTGYFLLGDNRSHIGEDSRYFGQVDPTRCLGQVFMRLVPAEPTGDDIHHGYLQLLK